jgi:pimeloyl-ACP methyl ester carboxylesterase
MGDRAHVRPSNEPHVTLETWIQDLTDLVVSHDLTEVVLVGHSQGGMVTTAAASAMPDRIARLVYLDAPVPEDGERGIDLNPPGTPVPDPAAIDLSASLPARPVSEADGFDEDLASWVNARLSGTPIAPSFVPVRVSPAARALPRTYVFFSHTPEGYPCWSTRQRLDAAGTEYRMVESHHDGPLLAPDEVVAALLEEPASS